MRRISTPRAVIALFVGALLLTTAQCRQIVGIDDRKADVDASTCASGLSAPADCVACIEQSCCAEAQACHADPDCDRATKCLLACKSNDGACQASCDSSMKLTAARIAFTACYAPRCESTCGPVVCAARELKAGGCLCSADTCCAESADCAKSASCSTARLCEETCKGEINCLDDCNVKNPTGTAERRKLRDCVARACPLPSVAGSWSCLGTGLKRPTAADFNATQTFRNQQGNTPLPGLTVRRCNPADPDCSHSGEMGTTDANGTVTLPIPGSFEGYFEVTGTVMGDAGSEDYRVLYYDRTLSAAPVVRLLPSVQTVALLADGLQNPLAPDRGVLLLLARDCANSVADGVSFSLEHPEGAAGFYVPKTLLPDTKANQTLPGGGGQGGFANVAAGYAVVTASVAPLCAAAGQLTVGVRAGFMTIAVFPPTELPKSP